MAGSTTIVEETEVDGDAVLAENGSPPAMNFRERIVHGDNNSLNSPPSCCKNRIRTRRRFPEMAARLKRNI